MHNGEEGCPSKHEGEFPKNSVVLDLRRSLHCVPHIAYRMLSLFFSFSHIGPNFLAHENGMQCEI